MEAVRMYIEIENNTFLDVFIVIKNFAIIKTLINVTEARRFSYRDKKHEWLNHCGCHRRKKMGNISDVY